MTRFHYGVVLAGNDTSWLSLRRTRIIANPFAFSVVGHTLQEEVVERFKDRPNDTYTSFDNGPTVGLWGVRGGWEIVDCDLYGAYITVSTHHNRCDGEPDPGTTTDRTPAWFGRIANSRIRYGDGVAIMADSAKQLIVEDSSFGGASLASMQMMDISTYEDIGYAQHLFFARNDFGGQLGGTQGGDGEGMNFDALNGGGASYDGSVVGTSVDGLTLRLAERCPQSIPDGGWGPSRRLAPTLGGAVTIVDGSAGTGQYRRLVSVAADGLSLTLDHAFAVGSDIKAMAGARILVTPYKGRVIFANCSFTDTNSVQSYGAAFDVVFARTRFTRAGPLSSSPTGLGPNVHVEMVENVFLASNRLDEWWHSPWPMRRKGANSSLQTGAPLLDTQIAVLGGVGFRGAAVSHFISVRDNVIHASAGLVVRGGVSQAVVEGTRAWRSEPNCVRVNLSTTDGVYERDNRCSGAAPPKEMDARDDGRIWAR